MCIELYETERKRRMEDERIIALYLQRSQSAVQETADQYSRLIRNIAVNVLDNEEDAKECENDTYMALWNSIPPQHPDNLMSYICRIAKNLSLTRFRDSRRKKRSAETVALDELEEILPGRSLEDEVSARALGQAIDAFLSSVSQRERVIFISRYWYGDSVKQIAQELGITGNAVSICLHRTRKALQNDLKKEGFYNE